MTAAGLTIRKAIPGDVPFLPEIESQAADLFASWEVELGLSDSFAGVNSIETFRTAQEAGRLWVVSDAQDHPVGFALVLEIDGLAHLEEMDILPAHGRKGLGAALLETVCEWARGEGYAAVTLSTFRDVPWNAPFYSRHGFRIVDSSALSTALAQIVEKERRHGLHTDLRVMMRRDF